MSEFGDVLTLPVSCDDSDWHRILRHIDDRGAEGAEDGLFKVVGIWRTPEEYVRAALKLTHPVDRVDSLPPALLSSVQHTLSRPKHASVSHQVTELRNLAKLIQFYGFKMGTLISSCSRSLRESLNHASYRRSPPANEKIILSSNSKSLPTL
jgi:hypothetical protein